MAGSLMIQGTGSGVGKSMLVTALCRIFSDMGISVAPFKSQNMALNSYISSDGGEIGRAQALQAEAARIEPTVDINPILLKSAGEAGSQVIIHGQVHATMKARDYYAYRKEAWKAIEESYGRLSGRYDLIVIEGAGSPAEINLIDMDVANMAVARLADAPVLLVGDIEKGGLFASLYGTIKLLGRESRYIKGFIVNKFRGDRDILRPGLTMIEEKTGRPVIGVLPYLHSIGIPEEDGLSLFQRSEARGQRSGTESVKIAVVRLKYISNFTDFDPFYHEPDVQILFTGNPVEIETADMVIIPGSKNTVKDIFFLRDTGLEESIKRSYSKGVQIVGICGGYQMLGMVIYDPDGVESKHKEVRGMGLLNIETTFMSEKTTCRIEAHPAGVRDLGLGSGGEILKGYEIHMGISAGDVGLFEITRLVHTGNGGTLGYRNGLREYSAKPCVSIRGSTSGTWNRIPDGSSNGNCWGTYIHGIFENDIFRRDVINSIRIKKGMNPLDPSVKYTEIKNRSIDDLADVVRKDLDIGFIKRITDI